jgi:predicted TIM-barrel fold metal-dependent hydrolase
MPGQTGDPTLPPLHDEYFDPFWAFYAEIGEPVAIHAGYGTVQGTWMASRIAAAEAARVSSMAAGPQPFADETIDDEGEFFRLRAMECAFDLRPRQAVWQLMLGGVFDRHPNLRVMLCEVRGDWLPDTIRHLDAVYERKRGDVPAVRQPSEYWQSNCFVGLSFLHKAEVGMRHEIGVDTIGFGRDFPHTEGTWPNTIEWLGHALRGVSKEDVGRIVGENAVRALGLDPARLAAIASRIGPTYADICRRGAEVDPRVVQNFDIRGGYLKPREVVDTAAIDDLLDTDLSRLAPTR